MRLLAAAAVLGILGALSQDDPRGDETRRRLLEDLLGPRRAQEDGPRQDEPKNTVRLRVYSDLDQLAVKAPALAKAGNYAEALAIYDRAVRAEPNSVVPVVPSRACGVWEHVVGQIGAWPEEGKEVYRRKVDLEARRLFQAAKIAGDVEALEQLVELYPYSSLVGDALSLAANLRLDAGAPARAADALERLLALEGDAPRPVTMARLGLAWARAGRKGRLEDLADRAARGGHAGAAVTIAGRARDLAGYLRELAGGAREGGPPPAPLAIPGWEMMGGHPSGSRLAEPRVELPRLAWSVPIRPMQYQAEFAPGFARGFAAPFPSGDFRPFFPAVSDGILYVHNETTLSAYNFFARGPETLWQHAVPEPAGEVMFEDRVVFATTVHGGRVYANLMTSVDRADDQLTHVRVKFPFPRRALFALDAHTGKPLWKLGGVLRSGVLEENATFSTPPTPEGGRLYVGAVRQKLPTEPFDHYVLCLDAATGKILWSTFVASGGTEINLFGNSTRESLGTPAAVTEDSVYYCTNHGAVAAIEKKVGRLRWAHLYAQIPPRPTRSPFPSRSRLGWVNSPPVAAHGVVAVTPMDAPAAYGLDARTGELRWAHPRESGIRTMVGLRDVTLVLGGEGLEFLDVRTGKLAAMTGPELRGTGRGVVAEDGVYVPAIDGLRRVNWDGTWEAQPGGGWGGGRLTGGNLIVVDGAMVLAAPHAIDVYSDRPGQGKGILAELEKDPDNPAVLYRGALRLMQSGDNREAERLLARVVEGPRAGLARPEDEQVVWAARKRLYAVRLAAGRAAMEARDLDGAAGFFERARAAAPDLASRVEASLQLGRILAARGDTRRGIEEFHRLLSEDGDGFVGGARVFDLARQEIDLALKAGGRGAYAPLEEEARRLLEAARRGGTAEGFLGVHRSYPNSLAAEEALFEAAAAHAKLDRADDEVGVLRQFLREYASSSRVPEAYARLARALERKGHKESAAALLRRMIKDFPEAEVADEGGARVTARAFAERRLRSEAYGGAAAAVPRPALSPPLKKVFEHADRDGRQGVALDAAGTPPAAVSDLLFLNYGAAVRAFDLRRGTEAWPPLKAPSVIEFAAFQEDALILAGERCAYRVDPRDGRVEWQYASPAPMRGFLLTGGFLCFLAADPRGGIAAAVSALETQRGTLAWAQPFQGTRRIGSDGSILRAAGEAVAFVTIEPYQVHLYERETGKRLAKASFTEDLRAELEHASDSVALVSSRGRFLEAYALPAGTLKWRSGMAGVSVREVKVTSGRVVVLGALDLPGRGGPLGAARGGPEMTLWVNDLENGKILKMRNRIDLGDARFMRVDGETAYVLSKEPDRAIAARAVDLGDLSIRWKTVLEAREATLFPPVLAKDHVAVMSYEMGESGKFSFSGALLDRAGRLVQNIRSGPVYERPPHAAVASDRVVVSADNRVEVYR